MVTQTIKNVFLGLSLSSLLFLSGCASHFGDRPDVEHFIHEVAHKDNFNELHLTYLFNEVSPRPMVVHKEVNAAEHTATWEHYRSIMITRQRIDLGRAFWRKHRATLEQAQRLYGVEPSVIVGIIGVETEYGEYMGNYRVIDSLSTLAFNYPSRQAFFKSELEQYLLLTRELNKDPLRLYGSYAGAMGYPQFMPSSYRKYAVSQSPDRKPDLFDNPDDAILSVANYFHHMGWLPHKRVAVILNNKKWMVYHNFNVIKKYNNSNFYGMAVYQLGQIIQKGL